MNKREILATTIIEWNLIQMIMNIYNVPVANFCAVRK